MKFIESHKKRLINILCIMFVLFGVKVGWEALQKEEIQRGRYSGNRLN